MKKIICCLISLCLLAAFAPAGAESQELPGKPWINSNVYGNWPSAQPGPEVSFDLYVNYEKYQKIPAESNEHTVNAFVNTAKQIQDSLESICTDPEMTGTEEECLRILYGLYMDPEKQEQDIFGVLKAHAERLRAAKTPEELTDLIREEGYLYGDAFYTTSSTVQMSEIPEVDPDVYYLAFNIEPIVDDLPMDEETFEIPGKDIDKTRNKLMRMGWSEEEAAPLVDRLLAVSDVNARYDAQMDLEIELMKLPGLISQNEIRELGPPVYELIAAQGLLSGKAETERLCIFQISDLGRYRELFREENLETAKAYLALGMYNQAERIFPKETEGDEPRDFSAFRRFVPQVLQEQAFVHNFVPQERIDIYRQLVDEYKAAMRVRIGQNSRLSEESKKEALNKIDHMIGSEVLYPYGEIDCGPLLEMLRSCDNLLEANAACRQLERQERAHYTGLKTDRGNRYITTEGALNEEGKYYPMNNAFFIGAGALVGEMADFTSRETILATLGFHLGHELSHGFDIRGAEYDAFGNQFGEGTSGYLFTEEDRDAFAARAKIIMDQISQVDIWDGNNLNGEAMIGEVMADLTSVQLAMDLAKQTEGFDYDAYFRAFARAYYGIYYSHEVMVNYIAGEVHPPQFFRINFTLPHFDEFYRTYPSVTEGTPVYIAPEDRILPW